jgi:DNA-binding transcriptional ArsR family regulator
MAVDALSMTFAALADPTRRAILSRLSSGQASVGELAEPFDISLPAVTKHLKVLQRAGLISQGREAQWRPCRLEAQPMRDAVQWMEEYRHHWEHRLDRLDDYLRQSARPESPKKNRGRRKK